MSINESLFREIEAFIYREAELLDNHQHGEWLELWDEQASYRMPVRVTHTKRQHDQEFQENFGHFDETKEMLGMRVKRLSTSTAWAEDPQSRTRHFVTNLRINELDNGQYELKTNLMLYRNRSDNAGHDILSAERHDTLHKVEGEWRILKRVIYMDQATLGTLNLSIFL
ncbi:MAG: aromatic-ring-hydroxylating dioxygenase subunit beta [Piscirickettsiaceae bacterium]|nr:MAG: aromatic-ring-hydroxylating dioxygenase subunit beta [Piscirickettsiaceae bacterium]